MVRNTELTQKDIDLLKMLFEEHHRQLSAKRQKIHSTTEKALAAFLLIAGWLIVAKDNISPGILFVIIGVVAILAVASCASVRTNNRSYYKVARVIGRINVALHLCKKGLFGLEESICPEEWENFGKEGEFKGWIYHILAIASGAALCAVAALLKLL